MGEALVAEEAGAFGAQRHHLGDDGFVVGLAAALAARDPGPERLLAQIASRRELQERLDARARQRDHVSLREPALLRGGARGVAHVIRQARQVRLAVEHQRIGLLVGQHVLAERGPERRQPLVDGGEPRLGGGIERRAGALEIQMIALEHPRLLGVEPEPVAGAVQRIDAAEQGGVVQDAVPMAGAAGRDVALDRQQLRIAVGAGEGPEHVGHPPDQPAGQFERRDRVVEARRIRIGRDRRDLGVMGRKGAIEGRPEMLRLDAPERRGAERSGPFLEQRIVGGGWRRGGGRCGLVHAAKPFWSRP